MHRMFLSMLLGLSLIFSVGCHKDKGTKTPAGQKSLYERLGGKDAITAVVDDFVSNVAADARINFFFADANIPNLKKQLVDQICAATGGPCKYEGKDMKTAHKGMGVLEPEFNALVEDLTKSLVKFKVGETEQKELLGALASMKGDIVDTTSLYARLGGKAAITAVIDDFIVNVAADKRINSFFAKTDITNLKKQLVDQVCAATGGPCKYTGKDMKAAHRGMGISEEQFNALVGDLARSLDKFNVAKKEKDELLSALGGMKGDIVDNSLYARLGGKDAITKVVDDFVANVAADKRINKFFAKTDITNLKKQLVDQICEATGGPCSYTGKDMKTAHRGMNVSEADFNALVEDLVKTLDKFKVGDKEKNELLGALGSMKDDIVTKSLFTRLGGKEAITAVVDDFVNNVAADARINKFFAKTDVVKLKAQLVDQICEATGGPCKYKGKTMKAAHKGMKITEADFNALVEDLTKSLDKFKVGQAEKDELLGALGGMKKDIVTAK